MLDIRQIHKHFNGDESSEDINKQVGIKDLKMINYVTADITDIEEIISMRLAYIRDDFGAQSKKNEEAIKNQLKEYLNNHLGRDCFVFAAKEDGTIVATAFLVVFEKPANPSFLNGKVGNVLNVYTMPEKRRQGIAGNLMKMLIEHGKTCCLDFIELKATDDGYSLYKKLGFEDSPCGYKQMKYAF